MKYTCFLIISLFLSLSFQNGIAQIGGGFDPSSLARGGGGSGSAPKNSDVVIDTSEVYFFYSQNPGQDYHLKDTMISEYFLQYDPIRKQSPNWGHLGIPGTATFPLSNQIQFRRGLDIGMNQYSLYQLKPEDIRYYKVEQAHTRAFFSQGLTQEETTFAAEYAREFSGNLTVSMDYRRMSNEGFYENQFAVNSAFSLNAWMHSKNDRYHAFFAYIANKNDHLENGGISSLPQNVAATADTLDRPILANVFLSADANVQNRYTSKIYNFKHYYKLNQGKKDSLNNVSRAFTLVHEATYSNNIYKFTDLIPSIDSSFYHQFQTDNRGLRHYIKHQKLENSFAVNTFKTAKEKDGKASEQRDLLELGALHRYHNIFQEPRDTVINEVFLTGRWNISLKERFKLKTYAHFGVLGSIGDYRLSGDLSFDLGKGGNFVASAIQQLSEPTFIQNRIYVSQREVWKNDFNKSLSTELSGTYDLPLIDFKGNITYQLLNNFVYFDTLGVAQQSSTPISIGRLTIQQNVKLGNFHLDNTVTLQQTSETIIRIPPVYSTNSLYFEGKIFKKAMYTKLGFDLRLNSPYSPYGYQPLHGQFILQDNQSVNWQPIIDVFLAFKVKKVRCLVRYENALPLLNRKDYYYQVSNYAVPHGYFRWAVAWQFID